MTKQFLPFIAICLAIFGITACQNNTDNSGAISSREHFIETQFFDSSVKPADDFYRFVNGKWLDTAKIPEDQPAIGSFYSLRIATRKKVRSLLEDASKSNAKPGSIEQKVGDFYASGMDTLIINKRGFDPVKPLLAQIDTVSNVASLLRFAAIEEKNGNETLFSFHVLPDQKNSSMNIANLFQGGIGLPNRDYYFKSDSITAAIQDVYKNYLVSLLLLTGTNAATAAKNAATIYAIEKEIAQSHKTRVQLRDVQSNYNKMALTQIEKEQPNIGWSSFFNTIGAHVDSVNMRQPAYYAKLNTLLHTVPLADWKLYLKAYTLKHYANILSRPFQDAEFEYTKVINGQKVPKAHWEVLTIATDQKLGEALGQLYVQRYFPPEAKQRINELVDNLTKAFTERIKKSDWMSDSTKATALEKLNGYSRKIGYPGKWRDYSEVTIDKSKYFENTLACDQNNFDFNLSQLGKPVDKSLWRMTPTTINAYYNFTANDINFPAAFLQFPFFDKDADDAVNYGGIGEVIGHEITHGFDDQGARFDKEGNIRNWWTKEDRDRFDVKVKQIQDLYSRFTILDSVHINGQLTTGENMADFGGLAIAYDAFKMTRQGQDTTKIGGYTPDQRFFMSYVQAGRIKIADETARILINTNPHSPVYWRKMGPLMNFTPFYKAFNVQPGDKMYRPDSTRIHIW
ncbi:M13 family metallopeptidase [Agriterribacter sp.]|uniref:M13 family metallopeptidase n=1 Tax=Agriterribacter sp. TaxID=2821509 RepID=UPI002CAB1020|nr:M13 family metallopeptidase [Agriterribacter sp.]HRP55451.1 M13 family metallopeptidase [Agriterribacter sp.]